MPQLFTRRTKNYVTLCCLFSALDFSSGLSSGFTRDPAKQSIQWTVRENGHFRADRGQFFQERDELDVYQGGLDSGTVWSTAENKYVLLREIQPSWKGEPYYHELYQLQNGQWVPKQHSFSQAPERYLDFGPCDARNQVDLPDEPLAALNSKVRAVLPGASKIKAVSEFYEQFVTVVYSRIPKEEPSIYMTWTYPLYAALLTPYGQSWHIVGTLKAGDWAYFCGTRTIRTKLADGSDATILLVYLSAPQGSRIVSVSRSIRSFIVNRRTNSPRSY